MGLLKGYMKSCNPPQSPFRKGGSSVGDLEKGKIFLLPLLKGGRKGGIIRRLTFDSS